MCNIEGIQSTTSALCSSPSSVGKVSRLESLLESGQIKLNKSTAELEAVGSKLCDQLDTIWVPKRRTQNMVSLLLARSS